MSMLCLDTSMNGCAVGAVNQANGQVVSRQEEMARGQAEALVPMIEDVLKESDLAFSDLTHIVSTIGPGSFTGLRVGLSTAKSLALALDIPTIGLGTLEVLAHEYGGACFVITETKRDDFYVQRFGDDCRARTEPQALPASDILEMIGPDSVTIVGDANERFKAVTGDTKHEYVDVTLPLPASMLELARDRVEEGGQDLSPMYLRGADVSQPKAALRVLAD